MIKSETRNGRYPRNKHYRRQHPAARAAHHGQGFVPLSGCHSASSSSAFGLRSATGVDWCSFWKAAGASTCPSFSLKMSCEIRSERDRHLPLLQEPGLEVEIHSGLPNPDLIRWAETLRIGEVYVKRKFYSHLKCFGHELIPPLRTQNSHSINRLFPIQENAPHTRSPAESSRGFRGQIPMPKAPGAVLHGKARNVSAATL